MWRRRRAVTVGLGNTLVQYASVPPRPRRGLGPERRGALWWLRCAMQHPPCACFEAGQKTSPPPTPSIYLLELALNARVGAISRERHPFRNADSTGIALDGHAGGVRHAERTPAGRPKTSSI
ncbi:hypothetical protein AAFF_G00049500 [Aldrovandia affinis]|uniref:Uncharacterized protein n=1 Tax=Aldrovandia affinis TaxID=143900 RepID=A0AAD7S1G8_9TELE|nr:hypothetical protein AAFF_G00049500 [Aldrovandia affinis]